MHVAFDLDGTLDTATTEMQSLLARLKAGGDNISIVTGCSGPVPTEQDYLDKADYLRSLGFDSLYHWLIVIGDPPHARKADVCAHGLNEIVGKLHVQVPKVDILFDNSLQNARLCSQHCLVMVPWNTVQD